MIWVIRFFVAAAAVAQWFVTPLLRFDTLQVLLSLVVFVALCLRWCSFHGGKRHGGASDV
jgi:hypothetical protein